VKKWTRLPTKPKANATKVKTLVNVCCLMSSLLTRLRSDSKVKAEGVDALEKRFIGGDPTIEIELERAVRDLDKTFDYNKLPFITILETTIPKDDVVDKAKSHSDDQAMALFQSKLNDAKDIWLSYLDSHSDTVRASAQKKREYKQMIQKRGYDAADYLLNKHIDSPDNPVRCKFTAGSDAVEGNTQLELSKFHRAQIMKHANYPAPITVVVVDTMFKRKWASHLDKCISVLKFNPETNVGIVLMQWGSDGLTSMDCVGLVAYSWALKLCDSGRWVFLCV
jgi:hypothetical protein